MNKTKVLGLCVALLMAGCASAGPTPSASAEQSVPTLAVLQEERAPVMVLATFHFSNPNADAAQFRGINVMTQPRQAEIEALVDDLARFRPTRIALEVVPGEAGDRVRADYARYRAGEFTLTSNENHQIGFRLAHRLGHADVYPVDHSGGLDIPQLMGYAAQHEPQFAAWFQRYIGEATQAIDDMQARETINANLRWMNQQDTLWAAQAAYAKMAGVGAGDGYAGAHVASQWYERNLHIFANVARIATPGERVLLIIGQGHAPILRQLVNDHPAMQLVEPNDVLRD